MINAIVHGSSLFPTPLAQSAAALAPDTGIATAEAGDNSATQDQNRSADAASAGKVSEGDDASRGEGETPDQRFTAEELQLIEQLKQTDREIRQHEMAHQIAGGQYTRGASYDYEIGPDGRRYAVAGEVPIDYGPVPGDPEATLEKMQTVIAAALAPMDPSPKDYQVAARARQYMAEARMELAAQRMEARQEEAVTEEVQADSVADKESTRMYQAIASGAGQTGALAVA